VLFFEAEDFGVEGFGLVLILDHDAGELDTHFDPPIGNNKRILAGGSGGCFLKIAKCGRWQVGHEAEASGEECGRENTGDLHDGARAALIGRGRDAGAPQEKIAEAAEAGESDFHADFRYGMLPFGKEKPGLAETRLDAELMWCEAKQRFEAADEVKGRHACLACDVSNGERLFRDLLQHLSCAAQVDEGVVVQWHDGLTLSAMAGFALGRHGLEELIRGYSSGLPRVSGRLMARMAAPRKLTEVMARAEDMPCRSDALPIRSGAAALTILPVL